MQMSGNERTETMNARKDKLRIRIISAEPYKWYANKIGKEFIVYEHSYFDLSMPGVLNTCYVLQNYRTFARTIAKKDAIILDGIYEARPNGKIRVFDSLQNSILCDDIYAVKHKFGYSIAEIKKGIKTSTPTKRGHIFEQQ